MEAFIRESPLLTVLLVLFAVEQLAYLFLGSYPYRFGVRIKTEDLPGADSIEDWKKPLVISGVKFKSNPNRKEAYLRQSYPAFTWGPTLFSCQIITADGKAITRVGPATAILVCYLFVAPVLSGGGWGFLNGLCLLGFVALPYVMFRRKCLAFFDKVRAGGQA
jgi:hypothetical protein